MKTPTDEQLNLAMCEWMEVIQPWTWGSFVTPNGCLLASLPSYLSPDSPRRLLDEAEARLTTDEHYEFRVKLWELTDCRNDATLPFTRRVNGDEHNRCYASATARQRVIAILQVVKPELFQ